jgi:hypothetical protein
VIGRSFTYEAPGRFLRVTREGEDIPSATVDSARVGGRLRLVAVSRHRLWFAAPSSEAAGELGSVPGARAALVTAV